jgi:DNA-binding MarR family transcriptional regulator
MAKTESTATAQPDVGAATDVALREFVGYNMKRAFHMIQGDVNAALAPHGLRMLTFSALAVIVSNRGLRQTHLADALAIERPNLVLLVDELERADLITRDRASDDRRAYSLNPTDHGIEVYKKAFRAVQVHDVQMTRNLKPMDRATLIRALRSIETILQGGAKND